MREDLLREAESQTQEAQRRNEETLRRRREEVSARYPEIRELLERRQDLIYGSISGMLRGKKPAEDLPRAMEEASGSIREALQRRGLPGDYLSPVYDCPLCQDTGFVGETIKARCECVRKRYQNLLRHAIGLRDDGTETFATFRSDVFPDEMAPGEQRSQRQMMERLRVLCEEWANKYPRQIPRDIVLSGKSGLGKTFLLHAMANRLIEREIPVLLISAYSFVDTARRAWFGQEDGLRELLDSEVLMIDDLGIEPLVPNVTIEQLFNLINQRQRAGLATVISTNLNAEELKSRYTERIASRLTDGRICAFLPLRGRDIRNGRM